MILFRLTCLFFVLGLTPLLLIGCDRQSREHGHDHQKSKVDGQGHDHEASSTGASFKAGTGVMLTEETARNIGLETVEVTERKLPSELHFSVQIFGESHKPSAVETYHAECVAKAAGLMSEDQATQVRPGTPVLLTAKSGQSFGGIILGINKALAIGDLEILVGVTNAGTELKPGDFLAVTISVPREELVLTVPKSAVLRSAEGAYVYTQNGNAYYRTSIKLGAEAEGQVEVTDGLLSGDVVVTKPVEEFWLIELRATRGGGHSH